MMFRLQELENRIEFNDFIRIINSTFFWKQNIIKLEELWESNRAFYIHMFIDKLANDSAIIAELKNKWEDFNGSDTFKNTVNDFLFAHRNDINFESIYPTPTMKKCLSEYLFSKYKLQDKMLFLNSLKYYNYLQRDLEQILAWNILNEEELKLFWTNVSKYQAVNCAFIQKYVDILKNPKYAYNISTGNNQFYSCHFSVISLIKQCAKQYEFIG